MRSRIVGIFIAVAGAASGALAADTKASVGTELTGWAEPGPGELVVLESLEGDNLAEARKTKGTTLKIHSTKKDLDGDGIPELFFFVEHPMFCYGADGCTILVIHRASLQDPWREIGVLTAPAPNVVITPVKGGEFPTLRPLGTQPYTWNGQQYQAEPEGAPPTPASGAAAR